MTACEPFRNRTIWLAVVAKPQCESEAAKNLDKQGYVSFLPQAIREVRHARRVERVVGPAFPPYLFVGVDERQEMGPILGTRGVFDLVRIGGSVLVPTKFLAIVQAQMDAGGGAIDTTKPPPSESWEPGVTRLRFRNGPLSERNITGRFEGKEKQLIEIMLEFFGVPQYLRVREDMVVEAV